MRIGYEAFLGFVACISAYGQPERATKHVSGSGPNERFGYYASNFTISQSFPWTIHPDVSNTQSTFALHQYGACNYISAANLKNNCTRHESSSTPRSHYAQYRASLQTNNPGTYVEARVSRPGDNQSDFHNDTVRDFRTRTNTINNDAGNEANLYGPNYDQSTGAFQGSINYPPYVSCP